MIKIKTSSILVLFCLLSSVLYSQKQNPSLVYQSATDFTVVGKIMATDEPFHRVDTTQYKHLPKAVKFHLTRSAGIAIAFKSTSTSIYAKWCTDVKNSGPAMTPIAQKGLDLYIKKDGQWQFAGVGRPQNGTLCAEDKLIGNLADGEKEFLLYLPPYSSVTRLEIGVEAEASIEAGDYPFQKKILVYGSSIVQGAGASRPGMVYTSILARQTGYDFLNLGLSGSAKMEKEVADLVAAISADAYILDCIPNSSPKEVLERLGYLMQTVRKENPTAPILVMQSVIRESGFFDQKLGERVKQQNENAYQEFLKEHQAGMDNIYFLFADHLLGEDHDGTVDGTHPNDLGFHRMVEVMRPQIIQMLKKK
ncbi:MULTISPECIES: SGNH/GDSL hydrolase family protein [unclassified Myroides]|uniref:SGNH/GDSL hydrolase family protein n=1 Tax=unclassified Myroides TaxID=2642485 RepID=UPI003D2F81D2